MLSKPTNCEFQSQEKWLGAKKIWSQTPRGLGRNVYRKNCIITNVAWKYTVFLVMMIIWKKITNVLNFLVSLFLWKYHDVLKISKIFVIVVGNHKNEQGTLSLRDLVKISTGTPDKLSQLVTHESSIITGEGPASSFLETSEEHSPSPYKLWQLVTHESSIISGEGPAASFLETNEEHSASHKLLQLATHESSIISGEGPRSTALLLNDNWRCSIFMKGTTLLSIILISILWGSIGSIGLPIMYIHSPSEL